MKITGSYSVAYQVEVDIRKEGIGASSLSGKLYSDLSDAKLWLRITNLKDRKIIFHYDDSEYSRYADGITGRQLADENIDLLKNRGWEVEEINS